MKFKFIIILIAVSIVFVSCSVNKKAQNGQQADTLNDTETQSLITTNDTGVQSTTDNSGIQSEKDETDIEYNFISADWPVYKTVDKLMESTSTVVLGKVKGISFQMLDLQTAQPPTVDSDYNNCHLNTIYDIEIVSSYKGNSSDIIKMRMLGGLQGVYVKEQLVALGEHAQDGISVMSEMPSIEIGKTYLFVLHQYNDTMPTLVNADQSVYDLSNPLKKDIYSYISVRDIISFFGDDKWEAFNAGGLFFN